MFPILPVIAATTGTLAAINILREKLKEETKAEKEKFKGFIIGEEIIITNTEMNTGIAIIGPTGSGKSTAHFIPNLLNNTIEGSIICLDPKGEQYEKTSWYQQHVCGRNVIVFAPLEPSISAKYNLLEQCKDVKEVAQLSKNLLYNGMLASEIESGRKVGGVEWVDLSRPLLTASLLYCRKQGSPMNRIENAFNLIIEKNLEELDLLFSNSTKEVKQQYNMFKSAQGAGNLIASIRTTLSSNLQIFTDEAINRVSNFTSFTAEQLREKKTIIYIIYPEIEANYLIPFMSSFFTQIYRKLIKCYKEGKSLPIKMYYDEFANIGAINNFSSIVATCRSREISNVICLQSISQLKQNYGKDNADAILNNLSAKAILRGIADVETLKYFEYICGDKEVEETSVSKSNSSSSNSGGNSSTTSGNSISKQVRIKKRLPVDKIRCLSDNQMIYIYCNERPKLINKNTYYKKEEYLNKIKEQKLNIAIKPKEFIRKNEDKDSLLSKLMLENDILSAKLKAKEDEDKMILEEAKRQHEEMKQAARAAKEAEKETIRIEREKEKAEAKKIKEVEKATAKELKAKEKAEAKSKKEVEKEKAELDKKAAKAAIEASRTNKSKRAREVFK